MWFGVPEFADHISNNNYYSIWYIRHIVGQYTVDYPHYTNRRANNSHEHNRHIHAHLPNSYRFTFTFTPIQLRTETYMCRNIHCILYINMHIPPKISSLCRDMHTYMRVWGPMYAVCNTSNCTFTHLNVLEEGIGNWRPFKESNAITLCHSTAAIRPHHPVRITAVATASSCLLSTFYIL